MFFSWKVFFENKIESWYIHLYPNKLSFIQVWLCFLPQYMHTHTHVHTASVSFYCSCSYINQLWFLPINIYYSWAFLTSQQHSTIWLFPSLEILSFLALYYFSLLALIQSLTSYSFSVPITHLIFPLYLISKYWSFWNFITCFFIVYPLVISLMTII